MRFQTPLISARLIRRYKRFLADCQLPDGSQVTAHCANPGAMTGLAEPGTTVWLEPNDDPKKKLKFGWRLAELEQQHHAVVDTGMANRVIAEALHAGTIASLSGYSSIRSEVPYADGSRVDFLLTEPGLKDTYVEVKSATLSRRPGLAEFPDTVTSRGARHLDALRQMAQDGARAVILYLVQRNDCTAFALATDIDPTYADAHHLAAEVGVETIILQSNISTQEITAGQALPPMTTSE